MSREIDKSVTKLLNSLDLVEMDKDRFEAHSPDYGRARIFGGQFLGQAVAVAQRTIEPFRHINSFHCYFLGMGDPKKALIYQVSRVRDGASFSMRSVEVFQGDHLVFVMQLSFQRPKPGSNVGLTHQLDMPDVPMPEDIDFDAFLSSKDANACLGLVDYIQKERPFELRPVFAQRYMGGDAKRPEQSIWMRLKRPIEASRLNEVQSAAILAYASDTLFIDTALMPHGVSIFEGVAHSISLDHSIWFHNQFVFDDWILFDMESPASANGRGMSRGSFFTSDGKLIASVAQEGLIRKRSLA